MIFDSTDYCLKKVGLEKKIVKKIVDILKEHNYEPYLEDGYNVTENMDDCIKVAAEYEDKEAALRVAELINNSSDVYAYVSRAHINVNNLLNNKEQGILRVAEIAQLLPNEFNVIGDDINDYEMLKTFNGAVITKHNPLLNELNLPEYDTLYEYIEYLLNE